MPLMYGAETRDYMKQLTSESTDMYNVRETKLKIKTNQQNKNKLTKSP